MSHQNRRFLLLIVYSALALPFMVYGALRTLASNSNSPIDWVTHEFPARRTYDEFRDAFGNGDAVVLSWDGCTVDEPRLDRLVRRLEQSRAFRDADGRSCFERIVSGRAVWHEFLAPPLSLPAEAARRRLGGTILGPDGRTTCVTITFTPAGVARRAELVPAIRAAVRKCCGVAADDCRLAGPVIDGLAVDIASQQTMDRFALPSAILSVIVCWLSIRSWRAALMVFAVAAYSQAAALALVHYAHDQMNALLIIMPPLIQVVAIAGGIHLVNYYFDAARTHGPVEGAHQALRMGWLPCVLSSGTTVLGLGSLAASGLVPIRSFGIYAAAGVALMTGLQLALIPGLFALWPLRSLKREPADQSGPAGGGWRWFTEFLSRRHVAVTTLGFAAMLGLGWGIQWVRTSVRIETLFARDSKVLQDYRWLEQHVGPLVPIEIVLRCTPDSGLSLREQLSLAAKIEREIAQLPEVGGTLSAVDFLPQFHRPPQLPPPAFLALVDEALERQVPSLENAHCVRREGGTCEWRITAHVSALADTDYGNFLKVVGGKVEPLLLDAAGNKRPGTSTTCTGIMPLVHEIQRQLLSDLFASYLSALVLITLTMTVAQAGILTGLVAMVSNVFPTLLLFGLLGWLRVPMDIGTVMTASVALGLAVDDTLHYLTFFRENLDRGMTIEASVLSAYRHCGPAMIQTSLTCGLGLLVFAFSDFLPTSRFAWMMVSLIATALAGDLVLLPALLLGPAGRLFLAVPASGTEETCGLVESTAAQSRTETGSFARKAA